MVRECSEWSGADIIVGAQQMVMTVSGWRDVLVSGLIGFFALNTVSSGAGPTGTGPARTKPADKLLSSGGRVQAPVTISDLKTELPALRFPICLIIDDPAPCINPLYYYRLDCDGLAPGRFREWEAPASVKMVQKIPLEFCRQFGRWAKDEKVKGKFSVLPFPAGLGSVTRGLKGFPRREVRQWLEIVRTDVEPTFDITPECLTHTRALELKTGKMMPFGAGNVEGIYISRLTKKRSSKELVDYLRIGLRKLKKAGFSPNGITHPAAFRGNHANYAKAISKAVLAETGESLTYAFIDVDAKSAQVLPQVLYLNKKKRQAVVNIIGTTADAQWHAGSGRGSVAKMVDYFLTADGRGGRFVELMKTSSYLVWYTHWSSLYGNGTEKGFQATKDLVTRINTVLSEKVTWMKTSQIARYHAAREATTWKVSRQGPETVIAFSAPFECPSFTFSVRVDTKSGKLSVCRNGKALTRLPAGKVASLAEGFWLRKGGRIYVCVPLADRMKIKIGRQ